MGQRVQRFRSEMKETRSLTYPSSRSFSCLMTRLCLSSFSGVRYHTHTLRKSCVSSTSNTCRSSQYGSCDAGTGDVRRRSARGSPSEPPLPKLAPVAAPEAADVAAAPVAVAAEAAPVAVAPKLDPVAAPCCGEMGGDRSDSPGRCDTLNDRPFCFGISCDHKTKTMSECVVNIAINRQWTSTKMLLYTTASTNDNFLSNGPFMTTPNKASSFVI